MSRRRAGRPGAASLALLMILAITAAWWALALWPAGAVEPEWLVRTRAACFGSARGGLPDTGGWILLIGEPIGMLGVLFSVWGGALRDDLERMRTNRRWQWIMSAVVVVALVGVTATARRVAFATGLGMVAPPTAPGTRTMIDVDVSAFMLTDQRGRRASLAAFGGRPVLLTFAFGHCTTVCPTIVHDLRSARVSANRPEVPILIISLDPWRDSPERLPSIAADWELGTADRVLSGTVEEVEQALDALGVARQRDRITGDVSHAGTVMAMDGRGHVVWRLDGGWGRVKELLIAMPTSSSRDGE